MGLGPANSSVCDLTLHPGWKVLHAKFCFFPWTGLSGLEP